ncbi:MAG: glycosyltransferase family 39 protein [Candidatus Pacearchaeota archaeon]|jgi:4-amino-4-deoxy-L-arabinose transferase-like glycosyltransferase
MDIEKKDKKIKHKIKDFFNNNDNLILVSIILFAFIIRLYYFTITLNQPLWWDEAEYMLKAKSIILGTPLTGFDAAREEIIPLLWAILYFLWPGEYLQRFLQVLISTSTVLLTYLVAKRLFNKNVAIISSLLLSVFSINLFFTSRLLTYTWAPLIYLLSIYFFIRRNESPKYLYISAAILGLGIITYFSTTFIVIALSLFWLIDEREKIFKNKKILMALGIFLLVMSPFVTYYMITRGVPIPRYSQIGTVIELSETKTKVLPFFSWFNYLTKTIPISLRLPLNIFFILASLATLFEIFIGLDLFYKKQSERIKSLIFVWIWLLVPLSIYTVIEIMHAENVFYDAFLLPLFPAIFILIGVFLMNIFSYLKKYDKVFAFFIIFALMLLFMYTQIIYADGIIKNKVNSYKEVKQAGQYINKNSNPEEIIFSAAIPMMTYYSERATYGFPANTSIFQENITTMKPSFIVWTVYQSSPPWVVEYINNPNNNLTAEKVFLINNDQNQPTVVFRFR